MKRELFEKLKKINPSEGNKPKNTGNCQWCAIEGARVLLEEVEPKEIPTNKGGGSDPTELVYEKHQDTYQNLHHVRFDDFNQHVLKKLQPGDLMLVSLEAEDMDHAYFLYKDNDMDEDIWLIDPDRGIFVELDEVEDFVQKVKGWPEVENVNYLNGAINVDPQTMSYEELKNDVCLSFCILNKNSLKEKPLPEYGTTVSPVNDEESDEEWTNVVNNPEESDEEPDEWVSIAKKEPVIKIV